MVDVEGWERHGLLLLLWTLRCFGYQLAHTLSISRRSFAIESDDYCVDFGWLGWRLKSEMVTRTVYSIPIWV